MSTNLYQDPNGQLLTDVTNVGYPARSPIMYRVPSNIIPAQSQTQPQTQQAVNTQQFNNGQQNPYLRGALGLAGGLLPLLPAMFMKGGFNPAIPVMGAINGGLQGFGQANQYNAALGNFNANKQAMLNDPVYQQWKPYIQSANSINQLNYIREHTVPLSQNAATGNAFGQIAAGSSMKDAFGNGNSLNPTEMNPFFGKIQEIQARGQTPPNQNYYQGNQPPTIQQPIPGNPTAPVNNVQAKSGMLPGKLEQRTTPLITGGVQTNNFNDAYNNAQDKFMNTNPFVMQNMPNYYTESAKDAWNKNPANNPSEYKAQEDAQGQQFKNPFIPANEQSQIDERKSTTNKNNVEAFLMPKKVNIDQQNADTNNFRAQTQASFNQKKIALDQEGLVLRKMLDNNTISQSQFNNAMKIHQGNLDDYKTKLNSFRTQYNGTTEKLPPVPTYNPSPLPSMQPVPGNPVGTHIHPPAQIGVNKVPQQAVQYLLQHPEAASQFSQKYLPDIHLKSGKTPSPEFIQAILKHRGMM